LNESVGVTRAPTRFSSSESDMSDACSEDYVLMKATTENHVPQITDSEIV